MRLHFLGTGDAFGSGGRLQSCLYVEAAGHAVLVDCGATSMVALRRAGLDPNTIEAVLLTHLHGDHFGGLPFFLLDAQLVSHRSSPLTVMGPPGTTQRLDQSLEVNFPGAARARRGFSLNVIEMSAGTASLFGNLSVTPFEVVHPSGAPAFALRIVGGGKVLTCSGDTEWTDTLVAAAYNADLFVCECYTAGHPVPVHMEADILRAKVGCTGAKRVIVVHMGKSMLASNDDGFERAHDGLSIEV